MKQCSLQAAFVVFIFTCAIAPGFSQARDFSDLHVACQSPVAAQVECLSAITALLGELETHASPEETGAILGDASTTLALAGRDSGIDPAITVMALETIASAVSDPIQAASIRQVAEAMEAGSGWPAVFAIGSPISASPN